MPPPALPLTTHRVRLRLAKLKMPPPPPLDELPEIVLSVIDSGPLLLMPPPKSPVLPEIVEPVDRQRAEVDDARRRRKTRTRPSCR